MVVQTLQIWCLLVKFCAWILCSTLQREVLGSKVGIQHCVAVNEQEGPQLETL